MTGLVVAAWASLVAHALALSWIDARTHRLPNRLLASCALVGVTLLGLDALATSDADPFVRGLLVGTGACAVFGVVHLLGGIGMGDVKYAWILGFYLGTLGVGTAWWGLWCGFALAAVVVLGRRLLHSARHRSRIPFGPYMTAGSALACAVFALAG